MCCRSDVSQGKVIWSNLPKRVKNVVIRGPRLEFRPFRLENHQLYRCLIKSIKSNDILRTLSFDTSLHIHEQIDRKPQMNLTVDTSRLFDHGELRLICSTGGVFFSSFRSFFSTRQSFLISDGSNRNHQWIFDDQIPRSKVIYDLTLNNQTTVMIIPDFDFEVDSGNYQCSTKNSFGSTIKDILIDKSQIKLRQ